MDSRCNSGLSGGGAAGATGGVETGPEKAAVLTLDGMGGFDLVEHKRGGLSLGNLTTW